MESTLSDLGRQLLRCADASLLDVPLDQLSARVSDEEARDLLRSLHEAGEGDSMRDVLDGERLAHWVEETCTAREEQALCAQLRSWLGLGHAGDDDPARLGEVAPLPDALEPLLAWARTYDLLAELTRPAEEVLPSPTNVEPDATLLECALGRHTRVQRGASLLQSDQVRGRAQDYLRGQAASYAGLRARQALWASALPEGPLRLLGERLRGVLALVELGTLHTLRFVPAHPVSIEVETGVCRGRLLGDEGKGPLAVSLFLSGFEQRAIQGDCGQCKRMPCVHVQALAGRLLDACLVPADRLHLALTAFASVPSWRRFMAALSAGEERADQTSERLAFVVRVQGELASVGALRQRMGKDGRWTSGKLASPSKCLRSALCADRDRPVLEALALGSRTLAPQFVPADMTVLRCLAEHPAVQLEGSSELVRVSEQSVQVDLLEQPDGLLPKVSLSGVSVSPGARRTEASYLLRHDRASSTLVVAPLTPALRRLLAALAHFRGVLPPESYPALAPWLSSLRQVARVSSPKVLQGTERPVPRRLLLRLSPSFDEGVDLTLTFRALPLGALWPPGQGPELVYGVVDGAHVFARRDLAWERQAASQVFDALNLRSHLRTDAYTYRVDSHQGALALLSDAARLGELLEIEWAERANTMRVTTTVRASDLKIGLFKKGQWFALEGGARNAEADIAVGRLLEAARRGERFVVIEGRDYAEIERSLFERLEAAQLCVTNVERVPSVPASAAPYWLSRLGESSEGSDEPSRVFLARIANEHSDRTAPIDVDMDALRDYQREGVAWLLQRSSWASGVCLADEMGLGKTIQTLVVLNARKELGAALVIAPTSLLDNWLNEAHKFAPDLDAHVYRGAKRRELLRELGPGRLLITSYELLLRDLSHFAGLTFATQVIDEAQVIKNARTQRAMAVASIAAGFRIALSGTPVENRLGDLWSLFHLVAPGLLGSWARFRARFAVPIERYENEERARALRALVAPFVLRRTKRDVAKELPARLEVIHTVELSPAEQALYETAVEQARRALGKRKRHDAGRSVQILAELTRLRQLACHPRLVIDDSRVESSKLSAFTQLLDDILPRGHRVLVFSQFTRHLGLVREALATREISYLYLDGSTPQAQRSALVESFQRGDAPVFLISLKAGGTGLNLTAADYVVHLDPWWNPAVEDQASDRAHRIGQDKPVTIVKLVAQGTIEERVLSLHGHKRRLADAVLEGTASPTDLDIAALESLLSR